MQKYNGNNIFFNWSQIFHSWLNLFAAPALQLPSFNKKSKTEKKQIQFDRLNLGLVWLNLELGGV